MRRKVLVWAPRRRLCARANIGRNECPCQSFCTTPKALWSLGKLVPINRLWWLPPPPSISLDGQTISKRTCDTVQIVCTSMLKKSFDFLSLLLPLVLHFFSSILPCRHRRRRRRASLLYIFFSRLMDLGKRNRRYQLVRSN